MTATAPTVCLKRKRTAMATTTTFKYNEGPDHTFVIADGRKVAIQNEGQGVAIFIEGHEYPVAYVDFYYVDPEGKLGYHREPAPQMVIYNSAAPDGDPIGYIKF